MALLNFKGIIKAELRNTLPKLASKQKASELSNRELRYCRNVFAANYIGKEITYIEKGKEKNGIVIGETKELFYVLLDNGRTKKLVKRQSSFMIEKTLFQFPEEYKNLMDSKIELAGHFLIGDLVQRMTRFL